MTPTSGEHGRVEGNVYAALRRFVRAHGLGLVLVGEVGIYTRRNPDRVRAADVLFISSQRYAARDASLSYLDVGPELVVEILSPRDTVMDYTEKLRECFAIGVRLVWIVDPASRRVLVHRAVTDVSQLDASQTLTADDVLPGFTVPVSAFFDE